MKPVSKLILLLTVFSLVLAACGSDEPEVVVEDSTVVEEPAIQEEESELPALEEVALEQEEDTAVSEEPVAEEAVAEPAAEEPETAEEPDEEMMKQEAVALKDLELSSLDELTSYRYEMSMDMTATDSTGQETSQSVQMELAVSTDPPATSMLITTEGPADMEEMGEMEFVQIEDTSYISMADMGCMALPADDNAAMSTDELTEGFSPESLTEDLENVTLVGEETINGIDVLHYTYDETSMIAEAVTGIESVEGHIYLAKDGGYMIRSIVDIVGNSKYMEGFATDDFQPETAVTHIEMNLLAVNEAVEILPPAACEGQEMGGSDWPMLDDASDVTSFGGITSYTTAASAEDTINFYQEQMVALGFTQDESSSFISEGSGLITYVNEDGESVSVTISENGGLTSVTILADAEE